MAIYNQKAVESVTHTGILLLAMATTMAVTSVYYIRPGAINSAIYWMLFTHVPNLLLLILSAFRPAVVLTAESRLVKAMRAQVLSTSESGKGHAFKSSAIKLAKIYHSIVVALLIVSALGTLITFVIRLVYYVDGTDKSTPGTTSASLLLILMDISIALISVILVCVQLYQRRRYSQQQVSDYTNLAASNLDGNAGSRKKRGSKLLGDQ